MAIFISYRREDTGPHAGRLFSDLCDRFGNAQVFMDLDDVPIGSRFADVLEQALADCRVLLALIGRQWLLCTREGKRRLEHPDDWVRNEIASSLGRDIHVVPVLFDAVPLPPANELPDVLQPLRERQYVEIDYRRWDADLAALSDRLVRDAGLELVENDPGSATTGLRQLAQLIRGEPEVADTVGRSREVMEQTERQVGKLTVYKKIHDAFHTIEFECLRPIQAAGSATRLRPHKIRFSSEMRRIQECLDRHDLNPALRQDIRDQLDETWAAFEAAVDRPAEESLTALLGALNRLVSGLPERLDAGIADSAVELDLGRLVELMEAVRQRLRSPGTDREGELRPFVQAIEALGRLRERLSSRIAEHNHLQRLDAKLRTVCVGETVRLAAGSEWERIKKVRARIRPPYSPPLSAAYDDLRAIESDVENALKEGEGEPPTDLIREYFRSVGSVFRDVDSGLKELCLELTKVSEPLETVLGLV